MFYRDNCLTRKEQIYNNYMYVHNYDSQIRKRGVAVDTKEDSVSTRSIRYIYARANMWLLSRESFRGGNDSRFAKGVIGTKGESVLECVKCKSLRLLMLDCGNGGGHPFCLFVLTIFIISHFIVGRIVFWLQCPQSSYPLRSFKYS